MTETVAESTQPKVRKRQHRINKALAGALLATQPDQTFDDVALQVGAKNGNSLKRSLFNHGLTREKLSNLSRNCVEASFTANVVTQAVEIIRDKANGVLDGQLTKLANKPVGKLANRGQGEAAVLETLSRTWRNLNGNPDQITVQFGAALLSAKPGTPQQVDDCGEAQSQSEPQTLPPVQDSSSQ